MSEFPTIRPMLATTGPLPTGELRWEPKWDGWRTQVLVDGSGGGLRVLTRSGRRIEASVPELAGLVEAVGGRSMVLDGELVAGDGSPESFYLGARLANSRAATLDRLRRARPVTLVVFDVLWLEGRLLVDGPYRERREHLEGLGLAGPHWITTPVYEDGEALLAACALVGTEGAVAKVADSRYRSGRSSAWVKRKVASWAGEHGARRRPGARRSA